MKRAVVKSRAVFFDRDGVINRAIVRDGKPYPPATLTEFEFTDSIKSVQRGLIERGFILFIFTNQPDVARGDQTVANLDVIHGFIQQYLPVEKIYVCMHDDADDCQCRKPRPGMLLQAAREYDLDLGGSFVVGDRWRDISAGKAAGCRTILIDYGYNETMRDEPDVKIQAVAEVLEFAN